jgi:AraC-like DNA-binding protein
VPLGGSVHIRDRYTREIIEERDPFIESLFHQGIIINIPALSQKRRDELELLLSIFDQDNRQENHHIMNVKEVDFPERFRPIIRRLQAAIQEKEIQDIMTVEDDFLAELNEYENRIEEEKKLKEEERRQKEEALRKQEEAIKLLLGLGMSRQEIAQKLGLSREELQRLEDAP